MFVRNAWYVAAWSGEVGRDLLSRKICGEAVLLYRRLDGRPAAVADKCRHRLLPLSLGRLDGDNVVCGYHGFTFAADGRCVRIPSQDRVSDNYRIRTWPLAERQGIVWIWPGEPERADPALIPDLPWNDSEAWTGPRGAALAEADYRLVLDNLLDLTHETYVHPGSLGNPAVAEAPFETTQDGRDVRVSRWMIDHEPAPAYARYGFGRADRWQLVHYVFPSNIWLDVGAAPTGTGAPQGDRSRGVELRVLHLLTPATETTTWYFYAPLRSFALDDAGQTERSRASIEAILEEDKVILKAQQTALLDNPGERMMNVGLDEASVRVRRILDMAAAEEREAPAQRLGAASQPA